MVRQAALVVLVASLTLAAAQIDYLGAPCTGNTCDNGMQCVDLAGGECAWDESSLESSCTCGGVGGEGDPYFTGFSGQAFYFKAEAETTYNIFSEQSHLVNAHFVATELPDESDLIGRVTGAKNSSFIGTVAVQHKDTTVEVSSDREGQVTVTINGQQQGMAGDEGYEATVELTGVTVSIESFPIALGTFIAIETDLLHVGINPTLAHTDNMGNLVRGHLNLQLSLKVTRATAPEAHGILGQTVNMDMGIDMAEPDAFPGEGDASDYEASTLFGSDFAYNLYGVETSATAVELPATVTSTSKPKVSLSRRLMGAQREKPQKGGYLQAGFGTQRRQLRLAA